MSVRLHFVVEGQTEETFVNRVLSPHLALHGIWCDARCVMTSRKRGIKHRGGIDRYDRVRRDLIHWMKGDQNSDAFFTTMVDLYALPNDFPSYSAAQGQSDPYKRVEVLERAFSEDVAHHRFFPYIQLHEFEALLLADPHKLDFGCPGHEAEVRALAAMASEFQSPEHVDDGTETAPSKRIIRQIPEYDGLKTSAGPIAAERIGLAVLRSKCLHFGKWLSKLEALA